MVSIEEGVGQNDQSHVRSTKYVNGAKQTEAVNGASQTGGAYHTDRPNGTINVDSKHGPEPIAICGVAMRLPAGINTAEEFWELLESAKDGRGPIPSSRYNIGGFDDSLGPKGAIKTRHGYYLEGKLDTLDTSFFSMSKTELERTDPQQRQLLEVVRECFETAGEVGFRGKDIGCYVGTFGEDWLQMNAKENQHTGSYILNGQSDLLIANRVSYEYDLTGPSMVIKTGCSASLVGLHEACRSLQSGDSSGAIVCGTNLIMGPSTTATMTQEGILSANGSCKTFDADADGFARGEAINAVYIKTLSDAIRDGNPIRAIIKNTGTNSDGKSQGLMSPNSRSHEALMKKVYLQVGLDPSETAFVEVFPSLIEVSLSDPIETSAVAKVFGKKGVYIGSVKPNIGHSEGASGLTSLIKGVLALENHIIPPNIKFNNPNPKIPFAEGKLSVPVRAMPWPQDRAERISINSFGIGGTNAHVILESAKAHKCPRRDPKIVPTSSELLVFSANSQESLKRHVANLQKYLQQDMSRLTDLAYTLACRREHLTHRAFSVVKDGAIGDVSSFAKVPANVPDIVMVFSGQGAQWPEMGYDLIKSDLQFKKDIEAMDEVLRGLKFPPAWTIEGELQKPPKSSRIHEAALAQPLCTAIQIAMVNKFMRFGVSPTAVIGHSSGEIAAAYACGSITLAEAIITAYYRGYVTTSNKSAGGMAAIGLGPGSIAPHLIDGVVIACENSPSSTTISGDVEPLREVISKIKEDEPDVLARELKVDMAYHSHHMQRVADQYCDIVREEVEALKIGRQQPTVTWFSSVTGRLMDRADMMGPEYWTSNLVSRVKFSTALNKLLSVQKSNLWLEIGPHSTLAGPLRQICAEAGSQCTYVPTMLRNSSCDEIVKAAAGQLYQQGVLNKLDAVVTPGSVLADVPAYPWDHGGSFWYESRLSKEWRSRKFGHHRLLGLQVHESSTHNEANWRNVLTLEDEPWIADHKIRNDVVFPFAGYVSMAGEAIRQMTGIDDGYSLKHVVTHTALVLSSEPVEMITTLQRHRLTDSTESDWYNFSISSYAGSNWIRNCDGQVKASRKGTDPAPDLVKNLPRQVDASKMYSALAEAGFVYGPEFQGMSGITSSPTKCLASAQILNPSSHQEAPFHFHPAAIDTCLQLLLVVLTKGLGRNLTELRVPTVVHELDIYRSTEFMSANAWALGNSSNGMGVDCVANGETVLRLRGLKLSPIHADSEEKTLDPHAAARLEWYPDVDFLDAGELFDPPVTDPEETTLQEEVTLLCMIDSAERMKGLKTPHWHGEKFRNWLNKELERAASNTYPLIENAKEFLEYTASDRKVMIEQRFAKLATMTTKAPVAEGLKRIWENCEAIFTGEADTLDILMREDKLTEIYDVVSFGHGRFSRLLSETKPTLRILEVGAGTGGTTELMLRDLIDDGGNPAYSVYTFTDISAGFFPLARERFSYAPNMDYRVFDISKDPIEQGFDASSYDLIFAPNVIHATPSLKETLSNLRILLRPRGHMILTELCAVVRAPNYIFGNFSGWWLGENDGRPDEPYISVDRWDGELKAAGFTGVDTVVKDAEYPYQYCAAIVTQPRMDAMPRLQSTGITLLSDEPESGVNKQLINQFERSGIEVFPCTLEKFSEQGRHDTPVLSSLDLEEPFFSAMNAKKFVAFQGLLKSLSESQPVLWLTRPSQVNSTDPRSGYALGFIRTIRTELSLAFHTLEIDDAEPELAKLVTSVLEKVCNRPDDENLLPDREFIVDKGVIKIGRYHPFSLQQEMETIQPGNVKYAKSLEVSRPGMVQSVHWAEKRMSLSIMEGEVEIEVKAMGLNFKDVTLASGPAQTSGINGLGIEAAGIVRQVGRGVKNLAPGDRIYALAAQGAIATVSILPASLCVKIPDALTFEDAATMPLCFATALQALKDIGDVREGMSVLIHSAAGGVGNAAIQICKSLGAKIYATAGTDEKAKYLSEKHKIPREHIFSSHDATFYERLMDQTGGRGVDIVLNSLSGQLLHISWKCVAKFGKLIELSNRDIESYGKLDMDGFLANRSYCTVDIPHLIRDKPEAVGRLLEKCIELYNIGQVRPVEPKKVFDASQHQEIFRYLQEGTHIGKAVMMIPEDVSTISSSPIAPVFQLDSDAAYVLTGGLGGLGKPIATWMVERGATSLIFLSRSAGIKAEDQKFFEELNAMGCEVHTVAGQVENMADVSKALSTTSRPIKGIIHLAMVLRDAGVMDLTHEDWCSAVAPKVQGAWNLHNALLGKKLDFFFVASSIITVNHLPGQGNYAAASTFLEAFCQYRHQLGLPASTLNICPIEGAGFVAENPVARKNLKSQGVYFLGEKEFFDYFELSLFSQIQSPSHETNEQTRPWKGTGQIVMGLRSETNLDDPNDRTNWRRDRRMGIYHNFKDLAVDKQTSSSNELQEFITRASENPEVLDQASSAGYLATEISRKIFSFLLKPDDEEIDISMTLTQVGLDSLMAIELRRWWKTVLGVEISVLEIMAAGTLEELGKVAAKMVKKKMSGSTEVE